MLDFLYSALINPIYAIILASFLWVIFYFLFTKVLNLSDTNWKRLDYVWIIFGFAGTLEFVQENKAKFIENEMKYLEANIKLDISNLKGHLSDQNACRVYNVGLYSESGIQTIQKDQDFICEWAKKFELSVDSNGIPLASLDTIAINSIKFTTDLKDDFMKAVKPLLTDVNNNLDNYNAYKKENNLKEWKTFRRTSFGIFLFILAFAVRLSISTNNVVKSKKK